MCSVKCVYCEEEITIDEEAWTLQEPQPKCDLCRKEPKRMQEHIRRRGGIGAVFGKERDEGRDPG
jgi:hypothetical protein